MSKDTFKRNAEQIFWILAVLGTCGLMKLFQLAAEVKREEDRYVSDSTLANVRRQVSNAGNANYICGSCYDSPCSCVSIVVH